MKVTEILPGSPCWTQLSTSDVDAAKKFYGQLFGWGAETDPRPEAGGYTMFMLDESPVGAVAPLMNPQQPVRWMLSFDTKDIDATTAAAKKAGAQVWMEPMDVMDVGRWALLSDPTGAAFSLWQKGSFAGFGKVEEPNTFGWIDLATRDKDAAVRFYTEVLGWEATDDEMYPQVGLAGKEFGGVMDMGEMFPADTLSHWNPYFLVSDVDAIADKAKQLGGGVLHGPEDTPMEGGPRIALLHDGQNAPFGVFSVKM
ncbi:VOC family protein [Actinospica durhamensis]|uniref:VOC family protein n=1 Tax=Actinospica durhamensis TaxID=1508375 RepID=A0A941IPZ5_9ACTN|nr:VOC family protein [Actinospica durhamensis]MBR7833652.1 VOC family protein [Actinospica durhamensis]